MKQWSVAVRFSSFILCVYVTLIAGCTTTGGSTSTSNARFQNGGFSWQAWPSSPNLYMVSYNPGSSVQLSNGRTITGGTSECIRIVGPSSLLEQCYNAVVEANRNAGFNNRAQLVSAARQAIQNEGRCNWLGYDPTLDAQTRATGALASQSDNRLFFVRLGCN
jgi:hypothetical protein